MPFILTILKLCKKYGIEHGMIKELSYNDLLYLIIDFQKDEIETYLQSQKKNQDEVHYPDDEELTRFLCGNLPQGGD